MITYNWPIVLAKETSRKSANESSSLNIDLVIPDLLLTKSLSPEISITICYPSPPLLMITYNWPIVLAKPVMKAYLENQIIASIIPRIPLARTLRQELTIFINFPLKPMLMITYLWPVTLVKETLREFTENRRTSKKRKFVDQVCPTAKRICRVPSRYRINVPFPLLKTVAIIQENEILKP